MIRIIAPKTDPALLDRLIAAARHKMTPAEIRVQRLSWVVGQSGFSREFVLSVMPELAE